MTLAPSLLWFLVSIPTNNQQTSHDFVVVTCALALSCTVYSSQAIILSFTLRTIMASP